MKYNFKIVKALPLLLFFSIVLVSGLVLYQVKYNSKDVRVIKSQLIGKNIPLISILQNRKRQTKVMLGNKV